MDTRFDTLTYARKLERAGIERAHAEAIAEGYGEAIRDLIKNDLVTKDHLKSELTQLEARMGSRFAQLEARTDARSAQSEATLRDEIRDESTSLRRQMDALMLQIRALQLGGAIAAFALGAIVLLTRLIR